MIPSVVVLLAAAPAPPPPPNPAATSVATQPPVDAVKPAVEISEDGHQRVTMSSVQTAASAGSSSVPYNLTPDWSNDLRRQVGGLQVADMNGDGWNDVVVGCYISNSFPPYEEWKNYIYYNTGGMIEDVPSWASDEEVSTGDVQVGDINGDGFLDIFAANGGGLSNSSSIFFGSATGPSTTPGWHSNEPGGAWNNYAVLFDFDHDGDLDVVTANQGSGQFDPYRPMFAFQNDAGTLATVPFWQSAEESIQNFLAFGDLDGDGWEDLAVSKWINWESGVYMNGGGALAMTPAWTTGNDDDDKGIAWSDVDGDDDLDLLVGHDPTQVWENDGGTLTLDYAVDAPYFGPSDVRFADVDGDGDEDFAEIHFADGRTHIYLNEGGVLATDPSWTWDSSSVGTAIAFGDLTGDGLPELIVGNSGDDSVHVFIHQGLPCAADLDGDDEVGFGDILVLLAQWGPCSGCSADLDGDDAVGFQDLVSLLAAWGPC